MTWLAHWRQNKFSEAEVTNTTALIFHSDPGTGKSIFVKFLGIICGDSYFHETNEPGDFFGYFTVGVDNIILLHLDEFACENEKERSKIKNTLTSGKMRKREMQNGAVNVEKHLAVIISSNADKVISADLAERRLVFCELARGLVGAKNYLTANTRAAIGDGVWEYEGERTYTPDENNHCPGLLLFTHKLDNWPLSSSDSLRAIPQNTTLYRHQAESLDSVTYWWFSRLRAGKHVDYLACDDHNNRNVSAVRVQFRIDSQRIYFETNFRQFTDAGAPVFTEKWLKSNSNLAGEFDYKVFASRLANEWQPHFRPGWHDVNNSPWLSVPRLKAEVMLALGIGLLQVSDTNPLKQTLKYKRAQFFADCFFKDQWIQFVDFQNLYGLYRAQFVGGKARRLATVTEFLDRLRQCNPDLENLFRQDKFKRLRIRDPVAIDRDQVDYMARVRPLERPQVGNASLDGTIQQREYITLGTLLEHRQNFFKYMKWDQDRWDDVWYGSRDFITNPVEARQQKPWFWFGDHVNRTTGVLDV